MKYEKVDLLKLYNKDNGQDMWNRWLTYCHQTKNVEELKKIRYGIQAGMDQLVKDKLNTDELINWFIRLNRSIEITLKRILKEKFPSPYDNSVKANSYDIHHLSAKRKRDQEFEQFLKESSF